MPLQKLTFKPGVDRENTRYSNEGRWWDMDKVRFRSGVPEKIGGWSPLGSNSFLGVARFLHSWVTLGSEYLLGVGTNLKMYIERGETYYDITPIRYTTGALTNPFLTGAAGSSVVTVTAVAHGAITGDYVTFSGAATTDGILAATLNAEFAVTVLTVDTFTITATPCTAGAVTGGGAAVVAAFQVTTGPEISIFGVGYGVGAYGSGGYGLAASGTGIVTSGMRQWVGGNFGEDLIFAVRDGGLYYWSASDAGSITSCLATRGVALSSMAGASGAPTIADNLLITDDQHVVAIGTNEIGSAVEDPMLIRWCAQGAPLNWTPAVTNTAGDYRLTEGSYTYAAKTMRQENLIWTDSTLVSMQFVGPPVVFSFTTLANNITIASLNAVVVASNVAYWMGRDKFYVYNGQVRTLPCSVRRYVFSNINKSQLGQVYAGSNSGYNEVTWFYCSALSDTPDLYVTYNYVEDLWSFGSMARTAWLESAQFSYPRAANTDGKLYHHEYGFDDGTTGTPSAITAYLESADFDIGDGESFAFVSQVIPDVDFGQSTAATPTVNLTVKARNTPGSDFGQSNDRSVVQTATTPFGLTTEMCWVRVRGRHMSFRIESTGVGTTWSLGTTRIHVREDGGR